MTGRRAYAGLVAFTVVLAGCTAQPAGPERHSGPSTGTTTGTSTTIEKSRPAVRPRSARQPLTVKITLDKTTATHGRPISGEATVTNWTQHALTISDCHGAWLNVGLTNAEVPYEGGWLDCLSIPGTVLSPGTTHLRLPSLPRTSNAHPMRRARHGTRLSACTAATR
jgi:hypothetical protein